MSDANLLFIDTETTGTEDEDRLCQVAYVYGKTRRNSLFKPPLPIKTGAMATHHITNEMVEGSPPFIGSLDRDILYNIRDAVFVAHNAPFDLGMLAKEGLVFETWIDTLKVVKHLDTEDTLESRSLQFLRYHYGVKVDAVAHDAMGDVDVLIQVFEVLKQELMKAEEIGEDTVLDRMIEISKLPSLIRRFRFGKHKGELLEKVAAQDPSYLRWLLREKKQEPAGEEDWIYTLELWLGKPVKNETEIRRSEKDPF